VELCIIIGVSIDTDFATDLSLYSVGNRVLFVLFLGMKWPGCEVDNFV
jgi:hypothetical protein